MNDWWFCSFWLRRMRRFWFFEYYWDRTRMCSRLYEKTWYLGWLRTSWYQFYGMTTSFFGVKKNSRDEKNRAFFISHHHHTHSKKSLLSTFISINGSCWPQSYYYLNQNGTLPFSQISSFSNHKCKSPFSSIFFFTIIIVIVVDFFDCLS